MRNVIKIVSSVSSAALLLSGVAMAGAPTGYSLDTWTVNAAGDITAACPVGVGLCALLAEGTGFRQEQFTLAGKTYIRTILAEGWLPTGGATQAPGAMKFTDENLIQIGVAGAVAAQGLISKTRVVDGAVPAIAVTGFLTESSIKTGWGTGTASGVGDLARKAEVGIVLNVSERPAGAPGVGGANDFLSKFAFTGFTNSLDANVAETLDMDQTVFLNAASDKQRFVSSTKVAGTTRVAPAAPGFKFAANTNTPPEYITWTAADRLQAIWVAQSIQGAGQSAAVSPFSTSVLRNLSNNTDVGITNLTSTALATEFATGGSLSSMFVPAPTF